MRLVAPGDRKVRIELGSGSGRNPRMQTVIDRYMLPDFRRGQMAQEIMNGVRALLNELGTNQLTTSSSSVPSTYTSSPGRNIITGIFIVIIIVGLIISFLSSSSLRSSGLFSISLLATGRSLSTALAPPIPTTMTIAMAVTPAMMIVTRTAVIMRVGIPQVGGFGQLVTG